MLLVGFNPRIKFNSCYTQSEMQVIGEKRSLLLRANHCFLTAEVIQGDYGFDKHEEEVMNWIVKKAYDDVMNDPF